MDTKSAYLTLLPLAVVVVLVVFVVVVNEAIP
jgi:hypothetical protein